MRVLHVTRDFPPARCGGISTAVGGLVRALEEEGIPCAVASFDAFRTDDPDGSEPALLRIVDDRDLRRLESFAGAFEPDRLVLHADLAWDVAEQLRERLRVPLAVTVHVCHRRMLQVLGADRPSKSLAAQERALEGADVIVAPSRAAATAIRADYPERRDRLRVAGFTVDPAPLAALDEARIVSVGRFGAAKGTDRLIELLPHLLEHPGISIDVVGGLPRSAARDRRWRRRILDAAARNAHRVRLHGWLEPRARDAVLADARALLSTSRIETFGLAVLEGLARGVPACGYREAALVETAPDQAWSASDEPARVARDVLDLVADRPRARRLGGKGRAAVPTWPSVVAAWREALDSIDAD